MVILYNDISLVSMLIQLFFVVIFHECRCLCLCMCTNNENRIKQLCKSVGVSEDKLLTDCQLGVNAIRQINDKKGMSSFSLARIADYLNCSVDYLLGRTERPDEVLSDSGSLEDCQQQSSKNGFNVVITHSEISIDVSEHEFVGIKKIPRS